MRMIAHFQKKLPDETDQYSEPNHVAMQSVAVEFPLKANFLLFAHIKLFHCYRKEGTRGSILIDFQPEWLKQDACPRQDFPFDV